MIWKVNCDVTNFASAGLVDPHGYDVASTFDGRSHEANWQPLELEVIEGKPPGDFFYLFPAAYGVSQRAVRMLHHVARADVEVLPVVAAHGPKALMNVVTTCDVLDEAASDVKYFSSGRVLRIARFIFKEVPSGSALFRIPQLQTVIFCTARFRAAISEGDLQGLRLENVGES